MLTAIIILVIGSFLGSGILFKHARATTYLAAMGALWEGQWLFLTLLDRTLLKNASSELVFTVGSIVFLLGWLSAYKRWQHPYKEAGSGKRDMAVIVVMLIVMGAAGLVANFNGYKNGKFIMHGFYNGDTVTLASLVEKSRLSDGLVQTNPFAANSSLEYPGLLHAAIATLLPMGAGEWLYWLPVLTLIQIAITIPLFFLLWDIVWPEPQKERTWLGIKSHWLILGIQAVIVLYVMTISWDAYIYPQSHFFLEGLFLLATAIALRVIKSSGSERIFPFIALAIAVLGLLVSNAVTGTAAVVVMLMLCVSLFEEMDKKFKAKICYVVVGLIWVFLFFWLAPGEAALGGVNFSYTSAEAVTKLAVVMIALIIGVWLGIEENKFLATAAVALSALTFVIFFISKREIVVENSSRFIYHALLIAYPLLLPPIIRLWFWVRRLVWFTTLSIGQRLTLGLSLALVLMMLALPSLASVASGLDNLLYKDEQVIDMTTIEALDWLAKNSEPEAVVLASPYEPWGVPLMTGRSLVRIDDYWLSPNDELLSIVKEAFKGNKEAQNRALQESDYLLLKGDEINQWQPIGHPAVFQAGKVSVYKIKPGEDS